MQRLVVDPEESRRFTLIPVRSLQRQADRMALRFRDGLACDLPQGQACVLRSSVAGSHHVAVQLTQLADQRVLSRENTESRCREEGSCVARALDLWREHRSERIGVPLETATGDSDQRTRTATLPMVEAPRTV